MTLATRGPRKGNVYGVGGDSGSSDVRVARVAVYETLYLDGDMGNKKDRDQYQGARRDWNCLTGKHHSEVVLVHSRH